MVRRNGPVHGGQSTPHDRVFPGTCLDGNGSSLYRRRLFPQQMPCPCEPSDALLYDTRTLLYTYCSKCCRFRLFSSPYKFHTLPEFQRFLHYIGRRGRIPRPAHMNVVPFPETVAQISITPYHSELFSERSTSRRSLPPPRQAVVPRRVVLFDDQYSVTLGGTCEASSLPWYRLRSTIWVCVFSNALLFVGWPSIELYTEVVNTRSQLNFKE